MTLRAALACLLCLANAAQAAEPMAERPWSYTGPPEQELLARRVMETLLTRCPRIRQALPDVASFEAEYRHLQSFDSRYRSGHRVLIEGGPVLSNAAAKVIPRPPFIPGDHALFEILGPPRPGLNLDKDLALWLCDAPAPRPSGVTFLPMPELSFIGQ